MDYSEQGCESLLEMQDEELEVIQAIYMDDYVNMTSGNGPPLILLKLLPLQSVVGKDVHARVDLKVQFTTQYPYDTPALTLENEKGALIRDVFSIVSL